VFGVLAGYFEQLFLVSCFGKDQPDGASTKLV
jgi:hypothetical protein